ncbi:heavy-metal-associated domain-containing protein [Ferrimicrobium acidiphilum]|jgi:copper chaperone|uniref:Copper chaperone CopZ n=2 Tax=Ferrimicrobium acidiphilum TaxID=121039 RepID=A0A0D8FRY5_9ACTN|nr:heavy metal-associated domain-containing protein [Ferrimicrobium acidiphilum]KJE75891.1 copper chaperone CopZ [Ferrimicrobium acidiphilum DSM 19497]MCL5054146.1 heavy-metal-associated domain-containing protein [Gammaproteobacteria bacterium]
MMQFSVPTVSCHHCQLAIQGEVSKLPGVQSVDVDLETKTVKVEGDDLGVDELLAAIDEAGYDAKLIN